MSFIIIFKAIILGIIEGMTEFFPVSSTGHLIVFGDLLKFNNIPQNVFEITIQLGAIFAVVVVYQKKLFFVAFHFYKDKKSLAFVYNLLISFTPSVVIGFLAYEFITNNLFTIKIVAISLIAGGVVMIIVDRLKIKESFVEIDDIDKKTALRIGLYQIISMIPGVSRSGATIIGGYLSGVSKKTAAEFSFFLAIPTIAGATFLDLSKNYHLINSSHIILILIGFMVSFISSIVVIKTFIGITQKYGFALFGYYRIVLGGGIILLIYLS